MLISNIIKNAEHGHDDIATPASAITSLDSHQFSLPTLRPRGRAMGFSFSLPFPSQERVAGPWGPTGF
eukprot:6044225-Pyramimonas_sp.AAC.1